MNAISPYNKIVTYIESYVHNKINKIMYIALHIPIDKGHLHGLSKPVSQRMGTTLTETVLSCAISAWLMKTISVPLSALTNTGTLGDETTVRYFHIYYDSVRAGMERNEYLKQMQKKEGYQQKKVNEKIRRKEEKDKKNYTVSAAIDELEKAAIVKNSKDVCKEIWSNSKTGCKRTNIAIVTKNIINAILITSVT